MEKISKQIKKEIFDQRFKPCFLLWKQLYRKQADIQKHKTSHISTSFGFSYLLLKLFFPDSSLS